MKLFLYGLRITYRKAVKEFDMKTAISKIIKSVLAGAVFTGMVTVSSASSSLANSLYELATFGDSMGTFTNSLNQLLNTRSAGEQQQIQQRMQYVEQQAMMQTIALENFIAADENLASSQGNWYNFFGTGGDDAGMEQVYQAFKQYQSLFSPQILRATGEYPIPSYERMYIRWQQIPASNTRLKDQARRQFMSVFRNYARQFVQKTQSQLSTKRNRFVSSLKSVENSGPFAMSDKMDFDKAFWDYQSMFANQTEPQSGQIYLPEFPYNYALTTQQQPNFVYSQSIYQQNGINQFGYNTNTGMGYQQSGMYQNGMTGYQTGNAGMYQTGSNGMYQQNGYQDGRYNSTSTYQSNQVVPLGNSSQQLSSPYGAYAASTSLDLDARLRQQLYLKQKEIESSSGTDADKAYQEYTDIVNQWFGN
jgi:hypothetical protein